MMTNALWLSCKQLLPTVGLKVMFFAPGSGKLIGELVRCHDGVHRWAAEEREELWERDQVTHWTLLPEDPKDDDPLQEPKYCLRRMAHELATDFIGTGHARKLAGDENGELLMKAAAFRVYEAFAPLFLRGVKAEGQGIDAGSLQRWNVAAVFYTQDGGLGSYERIFRAPTENAALEQMVNWLINGLVIMDETHLKIISARPISAPDPSGTQ